MRIALAFVAAIVWLPVSLTAEPVEVLIRNFRFEPSFVIVERFGAVRWANQDGIGHSAMSQIGPGTLIPDGVFDSDVLFEGDRFQFTFDQVGTYYYFCIPHGSSMQGEIHVIPAPPCSGDVNDDRQVDLGDLALLLSAFGTTIGSPGYNAGADLAPNGVIDLDDLAQLLSAFGAPCE